MNTLNTTDITSSSTPAAAGHNVRRRGMAFCPRSAGGWTRAAVVTVALSAMLLGVRHFRKDAEIAYDLHVFHQIEPDCASVKVDDMQDGWAIIGCADTPAALPAAEPTTEFTLNSVVE